MSNIPAEGLFLHALFQKWNSGCVRYSVLRNYENLPYDTQGSDIDVIVHADDSTLAITLLQRLMTQFGCVKLGTVISVDWVSYFIIGSTTDHKEQYRLWGVVIDFFIGGVYDKGALKIFEMDWYVRQNHNDVLVLSEDIGAVLGVLKEGLRGRLAIRYMNIAKIASQSRWDAIFHYFEPLGTNALDLLKKILYGNFDSKYIKQQFIGIRRSANFKSFLHHPLTWFYRRYRFELSKILRYLHPAGMVISIHGVDGVGKSTVIQSIKTVLDDATHRAVFVQHLRPRLLPPLAFFKGQASKNLKPVLDPHGSVPSGPVGSLIRLCYLFADYYLGYWLKTRFIISKQPAILIYDRYAYDMFLDPRRFRVGLPAWVAAWFARLAPRPDLIICLHADPNVILARKQELPLEEIIRQVTALREFANSMPNAVLVSTAGSVDEVKEEILRTLFSFFAKREAHGREGT